MIHQTAIIDPTARLDDSVEVGPYSVIGADVEIGPGTVVGPQVVIMGPCRIGKDNRIFQFASVGEAAQDLKYKGEPASLEIGDRNVIREYVTLNRGTIGGNNRTVIGSDNLFMAYSHIAHDCIIGNHCIFSNGASLAGHVQVGDYATLGGFTLVHQFSSIGTQSFCGMATVVSMDVPPYSTAAGNRARVVGINKVGLQRKGFSPELIRALHKAFRELLKSRVTKEDAYANLQPLCEQFTEVREFVDFIKNSKRGIAS